MTIFWCISTFFIGGWIGMTIAAVFGLFRDARQLSDMKRDLAELQNWLDGYCKAQDDYIRELELELRNLRATNHDGN